MDNWKRYERYVAYLCSEEFQSDELTVIPNAKITGLSDTPRQIDVLIDTRFDADRSRRIIVDAKRYSRPIDIKDVETFHGMMIDCSASQGILVCPSGYTKAAKRRAQNYINLRILSMDEAEQIDLSVLDDCLSEKCLSRKKRGLVLWDIPLGIGHPQLPLSIATVGKCDECGDFHIWCCDCGQKFSLGNEDEGKCNCTESPWFWLTAIEEDIDDQTGESLKSVYLFLITLTNILVADRKPLK